MMYVRYIIHASFARTTKKANCIEIHGVKLLNKLHTEINTSNNIRSDIEIVYMRNMHYSSNYVIKTW